MKYTLVTDTITDYSCAGAVLCTGKRDRKSIRIKNLLLTIREKRNHAKTMYIVYSITSTSDVPVSLSSDSFGLRPNEAYGEISDYAGRCNKTIRTTKLRQTRGDAINCVSTQSRKRHIINYFVGTRFITSSPPSPSNETENIIQSPKKRHVHSRTRKGLPQKAHPVVIARRNDEAIQRLSVISGLLHFVTNDDRRIISPVRDGMSVENNFRGFTACRRYATCKEKYTFRTYGTKRTPMRLFLPTFCAYGTTFPPVETDFNRRLSTADPMFPSVSFVCSSEIKTRNDESGLSRQPPTQSREQRIINRSVETRFIASHPNRVENTIQSPKKRHGRDMEVRYGIN
jgi:hypothetical protein